MNSKTVLSLFTLVSLLFPAIGSFAQEIPSSENMPTKAAVDHPEKRTFWTQMFKGNRDRTFERKFDMSFIASPSYTREASFGIGGMASGLYRIDRTDSLMPPSNVNLSANFSINGFMAVSLKGNNYFKGNRTRLTYDIRANSQQLDFWGIDYASTKVNPVIDYNRRQIAFTTDLVYNLVDAFYIGAGVDFSYTQAHKIDDPSYLAGQKRAYTTTGAGVSLQYDTRDFIPNPSRGINIMLRELVFPEPFGNAGKILWRTTFNANYYQPVWKGGLLAFDLYGQFNSKESPWTQRETLGGMYRMRGYYNGRYIDSNIVSAQAELRQHLWRRIGLTAWYGTGTVFPQMKDFRSANLLPSYGIGFRWEFKHRINMRLDYGFGKNTSGFVLNVAEAF